MAAKFAAEITKLLKSMQGELHLERVPGDKKGRHLELHPSGFPHCPLKQLVPVATHGLFDHRWESPTGDYYCSVGTAVHTVFQKHFGRKAHVIGDWTCRKCGDVAKFSTYEEAGQCCGHNRHYEELGIKFRKTICGHTDALFLYNGEYWLLDYKTSSVAKVNKYLEDGEGLPLKSNVEQVRSYVVLLERQYKIKIKGWALLYCFHPDTLIATDKGRLKVSDLYNNYEGINAVSYNHDTEKVEYQPITDVFRKQSDERMIKINYNGGSISVSETHPIWSVTRNCYVFAREIIPGEDLLLSKD